MIYRTLGKTGASVSAIGFGCSPLGDVFRATDPAEGKRAVHLAIDRGINFFDVSPYYGGTLAEARLGGALAGKREKVFLATKCGRYGFDLFDFSRSRLLAGIDESLARLRTDYVDLLQAHDIEFADRNQIVEETVPALREIQRQGKARFIGITAYQLKILRSVAEAAPVDSVLSYCRYNLLVSDMDALLTPFVRERGIGLINASPLHMGILSECGPPTWHPAPEAIKKIGREVVNFCKQQGLDPARIALRFCMDHPYVSSTLVGMATMAEVDNNLRALEMELDPAVMEKIEQIVKPAKNYIWTSGRPENEDYPEAKR